MNKHVPTRKTCERLAEHVTLETEFYWWPGEVVPDVECGSNIIYDPEAEWKVMRGKPYSGSVVTGNRDDFVTADILEDADKHTKQSIAHDKHKQMWIENNVLPSPLLSELLEILSGKRFTLSRYKYDYYTFTYDDTVGGNTDVKTNENSAEAAAQLLLLLLEQGHVTADELTDNEKGL